MKTKMKNNRMIAITNKKINKSKNNKKMKRKKKIKIKIKVRRKKKMKMIKKRKNLMSHDNKLVRTFYKMSKTSFHNLILKKIHKQKKGSKLKMGKSNSNCLKLSSHKIKLRNSKKFMLNSLLMIGNKLSLLTYQKKSKQQLYSLSLLSTRFKIEKSLIFIFLFGSQEISIKKIILEK